MLLLQAVVLVSLVAALGRTFGPVARGVAIATFGLAVASAVGPIVALLRDRQVVASLQVPWRLLAAAGGTLAVGMLASGGALGPALAAWSGAALLLFHPLVFVGVLLLPCGLTTALDRIRLMLDVVVTSGAMVALTLILLPEAYASISVGPFVLGPGVALLADGMVIAAAITLWLRGAVTRWRDPLAPLAVAALTHVAAHLLVAVGGGGAVSKFGQGVSVLPFVMLGLAAVRHRHSLRMHGVLCGVARRLSFLPILTAGGALTTLLVASVIAGVAPSRVAVSAALAVGLAALVRQMLGLREEIAEREQHAIAAADRRLAALVHHGGDMLSIVDMDSTVRYASPSHRRIMGTSPDQLVGHRLLQQVHPDDVAAAEGCLTRLLTGEHAHESCVARLRDGAGRWRWIESVATNLLHEPSIAGIVINSRDISERKAMEARLLEQALLDPLTQLGNRRLLTDRAAHALTRRHRAPHSVALLLLDLDHFKVVNDTLGHAAGDSLLVAVASRLRGTVRDEDTIVRLGGDEFAVLLEDLDTPDEADATAARIQRVLEAPFRLGERDVFVRASIGVAWADGQQDVDELLTEADVAMYSAKSAGRGCTERYSSEMRATVAERLEVEADLRHALQRDELDLHFQPVIDLASGRIASAEALIRWRHPRRGNLLPLRFIPVAEESDLIVSIGQWVLRRAAADVARFRALAPNAPSLRVAVNLSARHLRSDSVVDDVRSVLEAFSLPGTALALEITETVLAEHEAAVAPRLQALRELGVCIALDDFGTGYSSLNYLRHFPIDVLKVDKSFVAGIGAASPNDGVTRAIISIGHSLTLRTVAEGVETIDQLTHLRTLGCALAQGYLFSPPVDRDAFIALLATWDVGRFATDAVPHFAVA